MVARITAFHTIVVHIVAVVLLLLAPLFFALLLYNPLTEVQRTIEQTTAVDAFAAELPPGILYILTQERLCVGERIS